MMGSHLLQLQL